MKTVMNEEIQKVKELEMELLQSETRKSTKRLNELLADDFFEFTQNGDSANKKDILEHLPSSLSFQFNVQKMKAKILSQDTILLHYILDRTFNVSAQKRRTLCSSIWQKRDSNWQMIFFQGTPATK
jgi:hypothetical protein